MILSQESQQSLAITSSLPWLSRLHVLCCRRKKNAHVRHLAAQVLMASRHREQYIAIQHVFPWLLLAMLWKMFRRLLNNVLCKVCKVLTFLHHSVAFRARWVNNGEHAHLLNLVDRWLSASGSGSTQGQNEKVPSPTEERHEVERSKMIKDSFNMFQYVSIHDR